MKVVVTGGSGKLGQWVVRELVADTDGRTPHEVTVFDRVPGPAHDRVRYLGGDVVDLGQVIGAVAGADAVIHLAAVHKHGIATNDVTYRTNVLGTFNVHEAAWLLGIRRVVSTSSEAVLGWDYREREFAPAYLPIDEEHPIRPQDAYGLSKEAGEAIARSYMAKCGQETVALRPPGIMSPEQMDELRRNGGRHLTRFALYNYVDVRDLAEAYRLAIERPLQGSVVLFTVADDSTAPEPLCDLMPRIMPSIGDMARALTGARPAVSNARAKALLGWQPRRSWRRRDEET
jgi:nucleoside-diphosphate-sugar epimerase